MEEGKHEDCDGGNGEAQGGRAWPTRELAREVTEALATIASKDTLIADLEAARLRLGSWRVAAQAECARLFAAEASERTRGDALAASRDAARADVDKRSRASRAQTLASLRPRVCLVGPYLGRIWRI